MGQPDIIARRPQIGHHLPRSNHKYKKSRGNACENSSGSSYGWVVVGRGRADDLRRRSASMLSLAVFLQPISQDMGWSRSGVSAAATIDFLAMGLAAFFWGALSDRYGTRIVVLSGSLLLGAGLIGASQATSLWQFQLTFGVLIGVAAGSFYAPMVAAASAWIEHQRSLAVALVSAGMGVSPLTVAPFASWLITTYDWRTAMLVIGIVALALLIPASFLVRPAPQPSTSAAANGTGAPDRQWTVAQALKTPQFITLALAHFACCAAHSGPIFHMVSYAMICGIAPLTAVTVYSLAGLLRARRPAAARRAGRSPRRQARSGRRPVRAGAGDRDLSRGRPPRRILRAVGRLRPRLWRRDAALRGAGARIFRRPHHGQHVRRGLRLRQPRHGAWARSPADGCSTPSTPTTGSMSARSPSASPPSPWR